MSIQSQLMRSPTAAAFITTLLISMPAKAQTYVFSDSQTASFADLATAKLSITDIGGGTQWTLSGIYDASAHPSAFLHSISYDYSGAAQNKNSPLAMTNFSVLAGGAEVKDSTVSGVSFTTKAGDGRFTSGDVVQWTFANTTGSQFSSLSAHLNAINNGNSVKFNAVLSPVSPVPEPATWLMFGVGAVALFGLSRRRRCDGMFQTASLHAAV